MSPLALEPASPAGEVVWLPTNGTSGRDLRPSMVLIAKSLRGGGRISGGWLVTRGESVAPGRVASSGS
jgi:hypothetical protein